MPFIKQMIDALDNMSSDNLGPIGLGNLSRIGCSYMISSIGIVVAEDRPTQPRKTIGRGSNLLQHIISLRNALALLMVDDAIKILERS